MELSRTEGMQSFDQSLMDYYKDGKISAETAMQYADHKTDISMQVHEQEWKEKDYSIELELDELEY